MPAITTNDLKTGMHLEVEGNLVQVVDFQHVKPGKGHAFVRTTLKNARNGAVDVKTFPAGEKVERVTVDKREMQYLYNDGTDFVFMDNATYDQLNVSGATLGDAANYIVEGSTAILQMYGTEVVGVDRAEPMLQRLRGSQSPTLVPVPPDVPPGLSVMAGLVIHRSERDGVRAFLGQCTHLGCRIERVVGDEVVCPCHGSRFRSDGSGAAGPAARAV